MRFNHPAGQSLSDNLFVEIMALGMIGLFFGVVVFMYRVVTKKSRTREEPPSDL